jgi:tagaturonate epimerase
MELEKYSVGVGERLFGFECTAQLRAVQKAVSSGIRIAPVWNKSNREHMISGTVPEDIRNSADEAVRSCSWVNAYYVDADHIGLATVDRFLSSSDFFTIDVADYIGKPASGDPKASFIAAMAPYKGSHEILGLPAPMQISDHAIENFADNYFHAITESGKVYRYIAEKRGAGSFITEVSMDEAWTPQSPVEMFLILAALAREGVPVQTIAPKFTGSFLKGIDYVGNPQQFSREFSAHLAVIAYAVKGFGLPRELKLSIHTGSDKFTLYPLMHRAIKSMDSGVHLKTAGTTWLEEVVGLAASGGAGLKFAKDIYQESYLRYEELCKPYLAVINISKDRLPVPAQVASWSSEEFVHALRHDPSCDSYNLHLRQLLHVGFRIAAEKKKRFTELLQQCRSIIEENVTANLYERHIQPLFLGN